MFGGLAEFSWGTASGFLKFAYKIADIFKTAVKRHLEDGAGRVGQKDRSMVQSAADQILDRRHAGNLLKKAAEIMRAAGDQC